MGPQTLSQSLKPTEVSWSQVFRGKKEPRVAIPLHVLRTGLLNCLAMPVYAEFYSTNLVCALYKNSCSLCSAF